MNEYLVGIDFGTTNTIISQFINNKTEILSDGISNIIPSKVGIYNKNYFCGNNIPPECDIIISNFKLNINTNDNIYAIYNININDILYIFFKHLYIIIINNLTLNNYLLEDSNNISAIKIKCVITVPSNFNDIQRKIIKSALKHVGFYILRIINEPSAGAISYGLNYSSNINETILVIDIGGGTTDITILEKTDSFFEIIHSEGLNDLGGNNFTDCIFNDILNQFSNISSIYYDRLWYFAQLIKEELTYCNNYSIDLSNLITINDTNSSENLLYNLSKIKFEKLIQIHLDRLQKLLMQILLRYSLNYTILIGGSTRIPSIQNIIKSLIPNIWIYPKLEFAVVEGACLYAGILENKFSLNNDITLVDVLPASIGVELLDGTYSIIINKNTPLPIKRKQQYISKISSNNDIPIKIYQGENCIACDNILIGEIIFKNQSIKDTIILDIEIKVNLDSIIYINILDNKSGASINHIITDISYNLDNIKEYDNTEILKIQTICKINYYIKQLNEYLNTHFISKDKKNEIYKNISNIPNDLNNCENTQLIYILKILYNDYLIFL